MKLLRSMSAIWRLFYFSFISLPYLSFTILPGLIAVIGLLWAKFRRSALDRATRTLLILITGLLLLSCVFAADRGEAFLQLANFLPFLLLFTVLPYLLRGTEPLQNLATSAVIATIPINLLAIVEYVLRAPGIPKWLKRTALSRWYRARPHVGRAMVMFGHPNALAGYLVLVLGLGLGMILYYLWRKQAAGLAATPASIEASTRNITDRPLKPLWQRLLYVGTFSCLLGIFASGSRNGLIVAAVQLLIFSLFTKASRVVWIAGILGLSSILAGAVWFGIGGRSLSIAQWSNDPRVGVWQFALGLLKQRPLLGWGLGNFKLQYPAGLIPDYEYVGHPHNFWLLLAVEAGIPLMLLFTFFVGQICYRSARQLVEGAIEPVKSIDLKQQQGLLLAYLLSFSGCIAFALFDVTFYDARINVMDWVVLAGLYSLTSEQ